MALVQVRAVTVIMAADETGTLKIYHPGDWVGVSKQRAIELLESGQAEMPEQAQAQRALSQDLADCGIYVLDGSIRDAKGIMGHHDLDACEYSGSLRLPWERTLIWSAARPIEPKQVALGFVRVEDTGQYASWEVAAMLRGNEMLASEIGDRSEQNKTKVAIGDLRLPVYDTAAVWVRKTEATEALIDAWDRERKESPDAPEHAFLRALYTHRVLLCSLPAGWLGRWRR